LIALLAEPQQTQTVQDNYNRAAFVPDELTQGCSWAKCGALPSRFPSLAAAPPGFSCLASRRVVEGVNGVVGALQKLPCEQAAHTHEAPHFLEEIL
jgi:hypothetical protein